MSHEATVHIETPEHVVDEATAIPEATIDHAEKIGGALARIDALEAAHETLRAAHDETRAIAETARDAANTAITTTAQAPIDVDDVASRAADKVLEAVHEEAPQEHHDTPPPPEAKNEAPREAGNPLSKWIRSLNIH